MAKTTRICKICGQEKSILDGTFGPTAKQVACKGECLKEYNRQAALRKLEREGKVQLTADGTQVLAKTAAVEVEEDFVEVEAIGWVQPKGTVHRNLVAAYLGL